MLEQESALRLVQRLCRVYGAPDNENLTTHTGILAHKMLHVAFYVRM
jgi:hypothetical protein